MRLQNAVVGAANDIDIQDALLHVLCRDRLVGMLFVPLLGRSGVPLVHGPHVVGVLEEEVIQHALLAEQHIATGEQLLREAMVEVDHGVRAELFKKIDQVVHAAERNRLPGDGRAGMLGIVGQTVQKRCIVLGEKIGAAAALPGLDRNGLELLPIVVGDIPRTHGAAIDRAVVREDQNAVLGHLHVQLRHVDAHADGRSDRQQRIFRCHAPRCAMRNAHRHAGGKLGHAVLRTKLRHRIGDDRRRHELHKQQHDQQDGQ